MSDLDFSELSLEAKNDERGYELTDIFPRLQALEDKVKSLEATILELAPYDQETSIVDPNKDVVGEIVEPPSPEEWELILANRKYQSERRKTNPKPAIDLEELHSLNYVPVDNLRKKVKHKPEDSESESSVDLME